MTVVRPFRAVRYDTDRVDLTKVIVPPYDVIASDERASFFDRDPPFTTSQLQALIIHEEFELIQWWEIFEIQSTSFDDALKETYLDETYSKHVLHF